MRRRSYRSSMRSVFFVETKHALSLRSYYAQSQKHFNNLHLEFIKI